MDGVLHGHTFAFLVSVLGSPARTFRYAASGTSNVDDHVWRCGCAAREKDRFCDLIPCGAHANVNRTMFERRLRENALRAENNGTGTRNG
jgi:hypothetical protein